MALNYIKFIACIDDLKQNASTLYSKEATPLRSRNDCCVAVIGVLNFGSEKKDLGSVAIYVCVPLGCGITSHRNRDITTHCSQSNVGNWRPDFISYGDVISHINSMQTAKMTPNYK